MTFCLGIRVKEGLVRIADTRVVSGSECITARKAISYHIDEGAFFVMSSGLRSVRDKTLTYFSEVVEEPDQPFDRLFKVVNTWANQIRRVAEEDKKILEESGMHFNTHALVGGQLSGDKEHKALPHLSGSKLGRDRAWNPLRHHWFRAVWETCTRPHPEI